MLLFSTVLYLLIRRGQLLKVNDVLNNLFIFLIPSVIIFMVVIIQRASFFLPPQGYLLLFVDVFLFAYVGNKMYLKSIELSPNSGYPLAIAKASVVIAVLGGVIFFNQPLTILKTVAIVAILLFSFVIVDTKQDKKAIHNTWPLLAFRSFFGMGYPGFTI